MPSGPGCRRAERAGGGGGRPQGAEGSHRSHAPRWGVSPPGRGGGTGSDGLCGGFGPDAGGGGPPEGSQDCGDRWNPGI